MLHLVPGETGGSELYARRLVPALLEEPPPVPIGAVAPVMPAPVPEPDPPQMGLFG